MKRFLLGMVVGFLAFSALWGRSRAGSPPPAYAPPGSATPARVAVVQYDPNRGFPPVHDGRVSSPDIPVPIVPGTRVTEAQVQPPSAAGGPRRPGHRPAPERPLRRPSPAPSPPTGDLRVITGRLSATEERARDDVRLQVDRAVADWLAPEVARSWQPPASLRQALVQKTEVRPVEKELDGERVTLYEASQTVDFAPARRAALVEAYHRELVARRLAILAGIIAFVLACLAALAGYIRADEATKGYYTNRLRLVSAAGVGAAGVMIYRLLV
jgi:hypothetical protein